MTRTRKLVLIGVLVLSVGLAGCSGLTGGDEELTEAERLQQDAIADMEDVDSYTFTMDMSMDMESDQGDATIDIRADGAANRAEERMYMNMTMDITSQGQTQSINQEVYQLGETMYVQQFGTWQSQSVGSDAWENNNAAQQSELLEDADVSIVGNDTVNGVEVRVLEVEPDEEALEEFAQSGTNTGQSGPTQSSMSIESATVRQYVAAESPHYVLRTEMDMEATVEGNPVTMTMTMSFDDLDEDVTIDVPEELQ